MLHRIILHGLVLLALQSCTFEVKRTGTWKNQEIAAEKRSEIKALNEKLLTALKQSDIATFKSMVEKGLAEKLDSIDALVEAMNEMAISTSYKVLEEFHVKNSEAHQPTIISSDTRGENAFVVNFQAAQEEMYVSLLVPEPVSNSKSLLVTAIYGRQNNKWIIYILRIELYSFLGKTAPELYTIAKDYYSQNHLVDALSYLYLADESCRPADVFFVYKNEKEIQDYYDRVSNEFKTKYKFPIRLDNISTKPEIFIFIPRLSDDTGFYPEIQYTTSINLKDTVALKIENEKIRKEVVKLFPGIDKDKKQIGYKAFKTEPLEFEDDTEHFEVIQRLK